MSLYHPRPDRWPQVSLRGLLIVVALIALSMPWTMAEYRAWTARAQTRKSVWKYNRSTTISLVPAEPQWSLQREWQRRMNEVMVKNRLAIDQDRLANEDPGE